MPEPQSPGADQRIGRAFRLSLLVIVVAAAVAALVWLLLRQQPETAQPVVEVAAPVSAPLAVSEPEVPAIPFTDISEAAGVRFVHVNGAYGDKLIPETMGAGLAFVDYDRDGDPDLLLVNSGYWPEHVGLLDTATRLFRNDGSGQFEDVTADSGLGRRGYGMGVAVGDYDLDGWPDLFFTNLGENQLFHNDQGRFREVTAEAGVAGLETDWSTGAAFFDFDRDGDLDLYVANYVAWTPEIDRQIDFRLAGLGRAYGAPNHHQGQASRLYRNDGAGRFSDISHSAGVVVTDPVSQGPLGKSLGVIPFDLDRDGWLDLLVANDTTRNFLLRNRGDGSFEEIGELEGIAYDRDGKATGAMGVDIGSFRNDQELGIVLGNFANEMSSLFVTSQGRSPWVDEAVLEGLGPDTRLALTFAVLFLDADLDGALDLFQANGHLESEINRVQPSQQYAQPAQLFWNCPNCTARYRLVSRNGDLAAPMVGRSAAYADIDGDGDLDLAIGQNGRPAVLLRNDQQSGHHWLRVQLTDRLGGPAIGAELRLQSAAGEQVRWVNPSRGYLSQVELPVTFGLGEVTAVERLEIRWPDGVVQQVPVPGVDRLLQVVQTAAP